MKNKATIINISLAVFLILSLAGNFILFNQFSSSKQALAELQTQFDNTSVQLKSAQTEFEKLQANIVGIDKSSVQGTTSKQLPTDPNQKLKSGITLWEAKLMIEGQIKTIAGKGYTEAQIKELSDMMAKDLGTTMDEINRLPVQDTTVVQQPTKPADNGGKTDNGGQTKPSTPTKPSTGGNTGGGIKGNGNNPLDKNNNGIEDELEDTDGGTPDGWVEGNGDLGGLH